MNSFSTHRTTTGPSASLRGLWTLLVLFTAAMLGPGAAAAQEEPERLLLDRQALSPRVRAMIEADPQALQFRRAWKGRVAAVRAARQTLERMEGPELAAYRLQASGAAVSGVLAIPVGLGLYSGATAPYPTTDYQQRLFSDSTATHTVRTLYREMSLGVFEADGTVSDWISLPQTAAYYEPEDSTDPTFGRTGEYIRDVIEGMDSVTDFGQFDNDGPDGVPNSGDDDGYVDVMTFVYPNWAKSCGGPGIWPHRWVYRAWWGAPYTTDDPSANGGNIQVDDYTIQAGLACDGTSLMDIGTFSHETGHALSLPDLYDTNGGSAGIGHWGLMGSGNWNRPDSPAHMSAWSKDYLGWVTVEMLTADQTGITLDPVYDAGRVLRYDILDTEEYFLLEHRNQTGSDAHLHGPGLLIWHVDQAVIDSTIAFNGVNQDESRKGVDLEEADGLDHLDTSTNRGDAGDPYPGSSGNTEFNGNTYPSSDSNDGVASSFKLSNIAYSSGVLTFDYSSAVYVTADVAQTYIVPTDSVLVDTITVATTDSSAITATLDNAAAWLTVSPQSGTTPFDVELTLAATGLTGGVYTDTLVIIADSAGNSPLAKIVTMEVSATIVTLGDSVPGTLDVVGEVDTFDIALTAGDTVDLALFGTSPDTWIPELAVIDAAGNLVAWNAGFRWYPRDGAVIPAWVVPVTGDYKLLVKDYWDNTTASYILKTRSSGAVVATDPFFAERVFVQAGGTPATDTIWVYNAGTSSLSWSISGVDADWLTVSPESGTLTPAMNSAVALAASRHAVETGTSGAPSLSEEDDLGGGRNRVEVFRDPELAPAGAEPVVITIDPLSYNPGFYTDTFLFNPSDDWAGPSAFTAVMNVYDARIAIVADDLPERWTWGIAADSGGGLLVSSGSDLLSVDTASGAWTTGLANVFSPDDVPTGSDMGVGDTLFAGGSYSEGIVLKIDPALSGVTQIMSSGYADDVAVSPDGTVYVAAFGGGLLRLKPDGSQDTLYNPSPDVISAVVYNPIDGQVYFTAGSGDLGRIDPDVLSVVPLLDIGPYIYDLEIGLSGLIYGSASNGVYVVDPTAGTIVDFYRTPGWAAGVVLQDGWLNGTTLFEGRVFRFPVPDAPIDPAAVYLAAGTLAPLTLLPDATVSDSIDIYMTDGSAVTASVSVDTSATWLSATPTSGTTPFALALDIDATGLSSGSYQATVSISSADASNSPITRTVELQVSGDLIVLGDSLSGSLASAGERDTVFVNLTAGDTVDFAVFEDTSSVAWEPRLRVIDPTGAVLADDAYFRWVPVQAAIVPAFEVPTGGTYILEVSDVGDDETGVYWLKARFSGAVVATDPWGETYLAAPEGGTSTDTIWIYNAGTGSTDFELSTTGESWLSVDPSAGTLPATSSPAPAASPLGPVERISADERDGITDGDDYDTPALRFYTSPDLAPTNSVPIEVTVDASALARGPTPTAGVRVTLPNDSWGGPAWLNLVLQVHDADITTVADGFDFLLWGMGRTPSGTLLVGEYYGRIWEIDVSTGAKTLFHELSNAFAITDFAFALDGAVMVADANNNQVIRIAPDGTESVALTTDSFIRGLAMTSDSVLVATTWFDIWRLYPDGSITTAPFPSLGNPGMGYDPNGERLLVANSSDDVFYEFDLAASTFGEHPQPRAVFTNDVAVGASGRAYHYLSCVICTEAGALYYLQTDTTGSGVGGAFPVEATGTGTFLPDRVSTGLALGHGVLYVAGALRQEIYAVPVDDGPASGGVEGWLALDEDFVAGDTSTVDLTVDMGPVGDTLADYSFTVSFDPSLIEYVPGSATGQDFNGAFTVDESGAESGTLGFSGSGGSVTDTVSLAEARFVAVGAIGAEGTIAVSVNSLVGLTGTDYASGAGVLDLSYVVTPGSLEVALLTTEPDSIVRRDSRPVALEFYVGQLVAAVGSIQGRMYIDLAALRVDSITPGSYGGTLAANTDLQVDSGWVSFALANAEPPTGDTLEIATFWVSAVSEDGRPGLLDLRFTGVTDEDTNTLLPYMPQELILNTTNAIGVWGDVDYDWRLEPGSDPVRAKDALICLNAVVLKDVSEWDVAACDVAPNDGPNYTGEITAADALIILKQVVGMDVTEFRVNAVRTP